ncbi:MAG: EAL domain-containing protein [Oceanococcus sp.]
MTLELWHMQLAAAGIHALAALLLVFRAAEARAGGSAIVLGGVLAIHAAVLAAVQFGFGRLAVVWWLSFIVLPGLLIPLVIAVANIGLLRRWLFAVNALFLIAAFALGAWQSTELSIIEFDWGSGMRAPSYFDLILAWAGLMALVANLDALLQWQQARRPQQRRRMAYLLWVLLLLQLGWACDALLLSGHQDIAGLGLQPWGFASFVVAYVLLFGLLWMHRGPRRIGATVPASVIQDSAQPLLIIDSDGRIQVVNDAAAAVLDRRRSSLLGQELREVVGLDADYLDTVTRLHGAGYVERIQVAVKSIKAVREVALQPMVLRAKNGEVLAVICSLNPGSDDPALAATSLLDPVTGLAGVALGEALVEQELRRHVGGSGPLIAAIFVRLDDTGVIASRHGQAVHDRLQNAIKERLDAVCDWPLDIARASGGGYLLLLSQVTDHDEVVSIAERAQEMLSKPFSLDEQSLQPPVSIAVIPDLRVYHDLVDVLNDARHGLEQARHQQGTPYIAGQRSEERTSLALALEAAIASDGLDLLLQPVIDLRTERPVGARVSLRWAPEGVAALEDGALRRLARRVHLEGPLNQWRLRQLAAMSFPKAWAVWLPVSLEELQTASFRKTFPKAITRLPFKLILELPDLVWQLPACRKMAADLSQAGLGLHGQDFSASARMLTHAAGLLPKTLALDARLVQMHSPAADAASKGLAETAKQLGAALRAEGVRKKSDIKRLRGLGVPLACGEYLGRAMEAKAFQHWLQDEAQLQARLQGTAPVAAPSSSTERRHPTVT